MKRRTRTLLISAAVIVLISILAAGLGGFTQRDINVNLGNGGFARITPSSTLGSLRAGATATIFYKPSSGQAGTIVLWEDFFEGPIMVLAADDTNVLLCLYNFDVDLRLLRINPAQNFSPFPQDS